MRLPGGTAACFSDVYVKNKLLNIVAVNCTKNACLTFPRSCWNLIKTRNANRCIGTQRQRHRIARCNGRRNDRCSAKSCPIGPLDRANKYHGGVNRRKILFSPYPFLTAKRIANDGERWPVEWKFAFHFARKHLRPRKARAQARSRRLEQRRDTTRRHAGKIIFRSGRILKASL